jgi:glutaminyl-peptide cyclotransferase
MRLRVSKFRRAATVFAAASFACLAACGHSSSSENSATGTAAPQAATFPPAPAAETTGGFDGSRAYKHVEQLVAIGPHSAGSEGIRRAQGYITGQLKSFGCPVEEQDFHAPSTPVGDVAMKNIVVKIPSANPNIILFGSHYDTKRMPNFVGADDAGSSTGVLLELARLLCARKNAETIWLAFFDGEEAFNPNWADPDNTYGSRQMAASLALSGDLQRVKAMILVDMVGPANPVYKREMNSTPWLTDIIWSTAARLGYGNVFVNDRSNIEDDHLSFLKRDIPSVDIIDLEVPYWHTPQDTLDKVDPRTLAITGHVLIEAVPELEKRVR